MSAPKKSGNRLPFLDWTRGLAAVIMLQGHVFHSFTRNNLREGSPYILSQFVGGLPPAIFLFLTGITFAFMMEKSERECLPNRARILAALNRAGYLFTMAYLFRLQLWVFGWGQNSWHDLFRVDILNCMGLAMAVFSLMAIFPIHERARLCIVLGILVATVSPLVSQMDWTGVPEIVRNYLAPNPNLFSFFPWAAYLAFGIGAGSMLRVIKSEQLQSSMQWTALVGIILVVTSQYFSNLPYSIYQKSEFWVDSPGLVFIKLGVTMVLLAIGYVWMESNEHPSWSWIKQLGSNSLLVYWVHIELVYGRWLGKWKEQLGLAETTVLAAAIIALMVMISVLSTRWHSFQWRRVPQAASVPD
jgi:uncharacterized membrane protein